MADDRARGGAAADKRPGPAVFTTSPTLPTDFARAAGTVPPPPTSTNDVVGSGSSR